MRNHSGVWTTNTNSSPISINHGNNGNNNNNNNNGNHLQHGRNTDADSRASISPANNTTNGHKKGGKNNDQFLNLNNQYLVGIQSKFRRKYYHKGLIAILVLIILILFIGILVVSYKVSNLSNSMCETQDCLRAASNILLSMDRTVDPCEDFYRFTCGNWKEEHPRPDSSTSYDWFTEKQNKVMRTIREFLKSNSTAEDPDAVNKTKLMYTACTNVQSMNKLGIKPILKYLKEFKLPIVPRIFNITTTNNDSNNEDDEFDLVDSLVRIKARMGMDILIGFDIISDPRNRNLSIIALGTPEVTNPLPFNMDKTHKKRIFKNLIIELNDFYSNPDYQVDGSEENAKDETDILKKPKSSVLAYIAYMRKITEFFIHEIDPEFNTNEIRDSMNEIIMNHLQFTEEIGDLNDDAENITKSASNALENFLYLKLNEIENATDELISPKTISLYDKYIPALFNNFSNLVEFDETRQIITSDADMYYLKHIKKLISETSKEQIELYLWWSIIEELILHTTDEIRILHNELSKILIKTEGSISRSLYCANAVNSLMGMAVSYTLAQDNFHNETLPKVSDMLQNIRMAFNDLVKNTDWMDRETKSLTLSKSSNMKSLIGFPDWIVNTTMLDHFYREVEVNKTKHLDNMICVLRLQMKEIMLEYSNKTDLSWASSPSNVNAFHTFQANTITVPIAILQYPFYNLGLEALNYGAIGAILGHELTHGFDDSGRMFDEFGNLRQWWSNKTIKEYVNRTNCFVKQYEKYFLPEVDEYIDGKLTLGENIADNGGLREAYYAYKLLVSHTGPEKRLPGLDSYTHEQLLFISFGNLWCETLTPTAMKYSLEDSHCPGHIRLKGVLTNSEEFAKTFHCPLGSGMNPSEKRCRIW